MASRIESIRSPLKGWKKRDLVQKVSVKYPARAGREDKKRRTSASSSRSTVAPSIST
jgi:hypothetical protein